MPQRFGSLRLLFIIAQRSAVRNRTRRPACAPNAFGVDSADKIRCISRRPSGNSSSENAPSRRSPIVRTTTFPDAVHPQISVRAMVGKPLRARMRDDADIADRNRHGATCRPYGAHGLHFRQFGYVIFRYNAHIIFTCGIPSSKYGSETISSPILR